MTDDAFSESNVSAHRPVYTWAGGGLHTVNSLVVKQCSPCMYIRQQQVLFTFFHQIARNNRNQFMASFQASKERLASQVNAEVN